MAGVPRLQVNNLPGASSDDNAANASPARGREMRQNLLSKLRAPPLVHIWDFWHDRQSRGTHGPNGEHIDTSKNGHAVAGEVLGPNIKYEDRLVHLSSISDVKAFWSTFNNFDIATLPLRDSVHLFHKGVKPVWEDPRNVRGGSWTFRVPREKAPEFWKEVCMMAIGEQLQGAVASKRQTFIDDICGISLSVRFTSILVGIWNRDGNHTEGIENIRTTVMENLSEPLRLHNTACYYKKHSEHSGFNIPHTSHQVNGTINSAGGTGGKAPSLTRPVDLPEGPMVPPRSVEPAASRGNVEMPNPQQILLSKSTPGSNPSVDTGSGMMNDGEALQDVEETLGAMKAAMDDLEVRNNAT